MRPDWGAGRSPQVIYVTFNEILHFTKSLPHGCSTIPWACSRAVCSFSRIFEHFFLKIFAVEDFVPRCNKNPGGFLRKRSAHPCIRVIPFAPVLQSKSVGEKILRSHCKARLARVEPQWPGQRRLRRKLSRADSGDQKRVRELCLAGAKTQILRFVPRKLTWEKSPNTELRNGVTWGTLGSH